MADIDIEADARKQVEDSAASQGGTISNFDASRLTVRLDPVEYDPPVMQAMQPSEIWSQTYRNCTRQARTERITRTERTNSTCAIELDARLKFSRGMSASNRVIETLLLGSNFSIDVDLSAGTRFSRNHEVSEAIDQTTQIAPCTELRVAMVQGGAIHTIDFRIVVHVSGTVSCSFVSPHFWVPNSDMSFPYSRRYVVHGRAVVTGVHIDKTWNELRARCEPGTACGRMQGLSEDEFWKSETGASAPPTQPSSPTPPAEQPAPEDASEGTGTSLASPTAIYDCGDELPVVAEGIGTDETAAEDAAFQQAQRIALTQCPTQCPARFVRKYRVKFDVLPDGRYRARWYGIFVCRR